MRNDMLPVLGDEAECTRRALVWLQRYQIRIQGPQINIEEPPEWVDEVLNMPEWLEEQPNNVKRYKAYRRCARHLQYRKRHMLPKELVMAVRCRYPEPSGQYTGYIHTEEEDPDQREEPPEANVYIQNEEVNFSGSESVGDNGENEDKVSVVSWDSSIDADQSGNGQDTINENTIDSNEDDDNEENFDNSSTNSENIVDNKINSYENVHNIVSGAPFTTVDALELIEGLGTLTIENFSFIENFIKRKWSE